MKSDADTSNRNTVRMGISGQSVITNAACGRHCVIRFSFLPAMLACLVLVSCSTGIPPVAHTKLSESKSTVAQRRLLVGVWSGEAPVRGGGSRSWVVNRHVDGTYRIDFTLTEASGAVRRQSEV